MRANEATSIELRKVITDHFPAISFIGCFLIGVYLLPTIVHDDGMFALRVAEHFASGRGIVYNPGEYIETSTDFLYIILLTPPFLFGWEPIMYLQFLGVFLAACVLALMYLATLRLDTRRVAFLSILLLGTHSSFIILSKSGLVPHLTSLVALVALLLIIRLHRLGGYKNALAVGISLGTMPLIRLDALVPCAALGLLALYFAYAEKDKKGRWINIAIVIGVPFAMLTAFLSWKLSYYGDIFPSAYYTKASSLVPDFYNFTRRGIIYTWLYLREYWLIFLLPVFIWGSWRQFNSDSKRESGNNRQPPPDSAAIADSSYPTMDKAVTLTCLAIVVFNMAYMLRVGGGYIEFRFMIPAAPFMFILISRALCRLDWRITGATVIALVFASGYHTAFYKTEHDGIAESWIIKIRDIKFEHQDFTLVGQGIHLLFEEFGDYPSHIKMATTAGGYVPFYARLYTIDMRGFNYPPLYHPGNYVIFHDHKPGHMFMGTPTFFRKLGIHLIFGHPFIVNADEDIIKSYGAEYIVSRLSGMYNWANQFLYPSDMQIIEVPMRDNRKIIAIYLTRNEMLDDLFDRKSIRRHNVFPHAIDADNTLIKLPKFR